MPDPRCHLTQRIQDCLHRVEQAETCLSTAQVELAATRQALQQIGSGDSGEGQAQKTTDLDAEDLQVMADRAEPPECQFVVSAPSAPLVDPEAEVPLDGSAVAPAAAAARRQGSLATLSKSFSSANTSLYDSERFSHHSSDVFFHGESISDRFGGVWGAYRVEK